MHLTSNFVHCFIISVLGIAICIFSGCGETPRNSVALHSEPTTARLVWRLDNEAVGPIVSVALHPDDKHVIIGRSYGEVAIWTIGKAIPDDVYYSRGKVVSSVSVSPDGNYLAWTGSTPQEPPSWGVPHSPQFAVLRDTKTGVVTDIPLEGNGAFGDIQFSRDSKYLALQTYDALQLVVINVQTFQKVLSFSSSSNTGTPLFYIDSNRSVQLVAGSRQWELDDSVARLKRTLTTMTEVPSGAFIAGWPSGFLYAWPHCLCRNEGFPLDPGIVFYSSFISIGSIDGRRYDEDLTFSGKKEYSTYKMTYVPNPREPSGGELITLIESGTNASRDVVAINLRTKRYQSLLSARLGKVGARLHLFFASPDGKAGCRQLSSGHRRPWALHEEADVAPHAVGPH